MGARLITLLLYDPKINIKIIIMIVKFINNVIYNSL